MSHYIIPWDLTVVSGLVSGTCVAFLSVLDGPEFIGPVFLGLLDGMVSNLGSMCSLRVTTVPCVV